MTTLFSSTSTGKALADSLFYDYAETIAPGISQAVDSTRRPDENWPETLQRVLISLSATDQQRLLLLELAHVGRDAITAGADIKPKSVDAASSNPDGLLKIVAWAGAVATVFSWL